MSERPINSISELRAGDVIRHVGTGDGMIVHAVYGDYAVVVRSQAIHNPSEWVVIERAFPLVIDNVLHRPNNCECIYDKDGTLVHQCGRHVALRKAVTPDPSVQPPPVVEIDRSFE